MNAETVMRADVDIREQAIARLHAPVDRARAVYKGLTLVGHRKSIEAGEMLWALPGGRAAWGMDLAAEDRDFRVVDAPGNHYLREQRPVLLELTS